MDAQEISLVMNFCGVLQVNTVDKQVPKIV